MDDLAYGDLSSNGATKIETSNIDALAKGGVRFTAYSAESGQPFHFKTDTFSQKIFS